MTLTIDHAALADRLYADAVAAFLREPLAFLQSKNTVAWQDVERYVRERADVYREELSTSPAVAERAVENAQQRWQDSLAGTEPVRVISLLANTAKNLLQADGREMILRVDRDEPVREILRWRFVSLVLPPGILVAAATRRGVPSPAAVRLLHTSIAPDEPVAQQHVHHTATTSFEELWAALRLRALLEPAKLLTSLCDRDAICPGLHRGFCPDKGDAGRKQAERRPDERRRHMALWCELIRQAFIARRVLKHHAHHTGSLLTCNDSVCEVIRTTLRSFRVGRAKPYSATPTPYPWPNERYRLQREFREAIEPPFPGRADSRRYQFMARSTAEERDILVRAFSYMDVGSPDPAYEEIFLQYLRVKTAVFRLLVHSPGERGLKSFLKHFSQINIYAPDHAFLHPLQRAEPGLRIRATERRISPWVWFNSRDRWDGDDSYGPGEPEKGWLVHFQRKKHDTHLPLYGGAMRQMDSDADTIVRALDAKPRWLNTLRGVDIAGVEEEQPLWVSAETLRRVRTRSSEIVGRRPGLKLQPLRLTLHAGEDFDWLTSGVRAVAEPFHWKLIERGDRIGHGIAITFDPKEWWKRKDGQVAPVKRIDRLLDLAFLAEYTSKNRSADQDEWLLEQIRAVVEELGFEGKLDSARAKAIDVVETAKTVWREFGGRTLRRLAERSSRRSNLDKHEKWIHSYLWNRSTQEQAHKHVRLKVDDDRGDLRIVSQRTECDLLVIARRHLIQEVARWQVCIESNPSSNLVVGGLDAMGAAQDFLQRRPTRNERQELETLTWTISTDDPITFSTTLADEYAYAWAGMVLRKDKPYDPSYARALLDEAAATSMRTRFTIPREDQARTGKDTGKRRGNARSA
jgi:adenosine deaminase